MLLYKFPQNIAKLFSGYNLLWHVLVIVLTYLFVVSGADWKWFVFFRQSFIFPWFFPAAALLGFYMPLVIPLSFLLFGKLLKNQRAILAGWALGQAGILGALVSGFYKALTGRPGPDLLISPDSIDISTIFRFGFWRGGVFWGWPSTHTIVAAGMAVTLIILYPKNKAIAVLAFLYAFYIGFGASFSFHWLSDCVAATILGVVIGVIVGRTFRNRYNKINS